MPRTPALRFIPATVRFGVSLAQEPPDVGPDLPEIGPSDRSSVWSRFVNVLRQRGIKAPFDRWFVLRAEQFQKTLPNQDLGACSEADTAAYLRRVAERMNLKDWQYEQIVDALEIMLAHVLRLPWTAEFDWASWRNVARRREPSHPAMARKPPSQEQASEPRHRLVGA